MHRPRAANVPGAAHAASFVCPSIRSRRSVPRVAAPRALAVLAVVASLAAWAAVASGAHVHSGGAAGVSGRADGHTDSHFIRPAERGDSILWASGTDLADANTLIIHSFFERKLDFVSGGGSTGTYEGRTFAGVRDSIHGDLGSWARSRGSGHSQYVTPKQGEAGWYSFWDIWAEGHLGSGAAAQYDANTAGDDPIIFRPIDFPDPKPDYGSLLINVQLGGDWRTPPGGIGTHVWVETPAGTLDLLDIGLGVDGVAVTTGGVPNMSVYLMDSIGVGQPDSTAVPISLPDLQSWLTAHVAGDSLTVPCALSIVLAQQAVADTFTDGADFRIHVDARVWEREAVHGCVVQPYTPYAIPAGDPGRFVVPERAPIVNLAFDPLGPPGPGSADGNVTLYGRDPTGLWLLLHQWDWNGGMPRSFVPLPGISLYRLVGDSNHYPVTGSISFPVNGGAAPPDGPRLTPDFALGGVDYQVNPFNPSLGGAPPPPLMVQPGLVLQALPRFIGTNHWQYLPVQVNVQPDPSRPWLYVGNDPNQPYLNPTYVVLTLDGLFDPVGTPISQLSLMVHFAQGPNFQDIPVTANIVGGHVQLPVINLGSILAQPYQLYIGPSGQPFRGNATESGIGYFQWSSLVVASGNQAPAAVEPAPASPLRFGLVIAGRNPATTGATLELVLPSATTSRVAVYDVRGALVRRLQSGALGAGAHRVAWDGRDAAGARVRPGLYFARADAFGQSAVRKLSMVP